MQAIDGITHLINNTMSLYFVRLKEKDASNAKKAIILALHALDTNGFIAGRGYFMKGKCNWYDVGGHWSGILKELQHGFDFDQEVKIKFNLPDSDILGYSQEWLKAHDKELQALWEEKGATWPHRLLRSELNGGMLDDAMRITPEILQGLKSERFNGIEVFDVYTFDEYSAKELDERSLGDWLVVIDYQS